ncbi:hypothetical protein M404DRAFT_7281 [Pisolithus tinctorius Marx 270]|uniref:Uncharacterized protein n=1 Tax=Pisolithus tinctorius Marx 270 TaxID=870435 RepID=A0A0C3JPW9_PISTI|nr:hypothetical protein M404DRAFT_7281 [Pisolithus tinctorius Marx 270]
MYTCSAIGSCEGSEQTQKRKYVWVAECINAGRALLEDLYRQGATLLLHLSPFDAKPDAYDPSALLSEDESETSVHEEENEGIQTRSESKEVKGETKNALPVHVDAELAAEVAGVEYDEFQKGVKKLQAAPLALSPLGCGRVPLA